MFGEADKITHKLSETASKFNSPSKDASSVNTKLNNQYEIVQRPGAKSINNKDLNEIKKFLKGVNNHTRKRPRESKNDDRWENVSFGFYLALH